MTCKYVMIVCYSNVSLHIYICILSDKLTSSQFTDTLKVVFILLTLKYLKSAMKIKISNYHTRTIWGPKSTYMQSK